MDRIIFLDIDGVLNGHDWNERAKSNTIRPKCVECLNAILMVTGSMYVVSSAWRYMHLNGAMTLAGLEYVFRTHGVVDGRIAGVTRRDTMIPDGKGGEKPLPNERGQQILDWQYEHAPGSRILVIDDLGTPGKEGESMGIEAAGLPLLKTRSKVGLTFADAKRAMKMLGC